jgi:hypothetical protein
VLFTAPGASSIDFSNKDHLNLFTALQKNEETRYEKINGAIALGSSLLQQNHRRKRNNPEEQAIHEQNQNTKLVVVDVKATLE